MKIFKKIGWSITACILLVGCGSRLEQTNLKKEGTEYKVGDNVRFYYPSKFELDSLHTDNETINFRYEDEGLFYSCINEEIDNDLNDRDELYIAELEQSGASNIVVEKPNLESGLTVYQIVGNYTNTGMRFKHIVYFTEKQTYVYGYVASQEDYEENNKKMTTFLQSIVIEESIKE